jgi:Phosphate-selective porin O and P
MKKSLLALALAGLYATNATAANKNYDSPTPISVISAEEISDMPMPSAADMWKIIQQQQVELQKLRGVQQATDAKVEATADAIDNSSIASVAEWVNKTSIGGYGEVLYNNGTGKTDAKEIDLQRFVLYLGHEFTDDVRFYSELEIEHANTASSGEVELEQAYIEWDYAENHSVLAGMYLPPLGIINETHEPDTFYGVERPRVESRIIPTTYRVNGIKFAGELAEGWSYDLGLHEGLSLASNLTIRSSRQSGAQADAETLAGTARVKYTGIQGLELGLAAQYQDDLGLQGRSSVAGAENLGAILTEAHAIYNNGSFGLRALYAQWSIDNDIESLTDGTGRDKTRGWYIEPSYKLTEKLGIFARYESIDERAGSNTGAANDSEEKRILTGLNYWLLDNVVLKADVQFDEDENKTSSNELDGFNLGIGWSF